MGIDVWLPQVITLAAGLGGTVIGLLSNRRKRVIEELGKLIELREQCDPESPEWLSMNKAAKSAARRLHRLSSSNGESAIVAVLLFMTAVMGVIVTLVWQWAIEEDNTGVWAFASMYILICVLPMGGVAWIAGKEFKRRTKW